MVRRCWWKRTVGTPSYQNSTVGPQRTRMTPWKLSAGGPIDDLIEMVLARKGRIIFLEKGRLQAHQGVAMILPY
jgi:hypothetical protein